MTTSQRDTQRELVNTPDVADVSVVMPAKDRADLIGRALASIARQTVQPREVIVVDDGSTDETGDVARSFGARVLRIEQSGGSGPARNRGIQDASSMWVAFLDSDDEWHPDHLKRIVDRSEDVVMVAAPGIAAGDDAWAGRVQGNPWKHDVTLRPMTLLAPGDLVCTSGTMVRRQTLFDAGLFRPLRRAQDLDMWVRVLEFGEGIALHEPSVTYHLHSSQASNDKQLMRDCFDRIVEDVADRAWFTEKDRDRCYARVYWDDLRVAQLERDVPEFLGHVRWFVARPHAWPPLIRLLRQRRLSRATRRSSGVS
jgi:glycosyltransferase involved in cell wall biosynthesis